MRAKKTNNRDLLNNSLHKFVILAVIHVRCKGIVSIVSHISFSTYPDTYCLDFWSQFKIYLDHKKKLNRKIAN